MSDTLQLQAQRRSALKKQVGQLRERGVIPAIMYGHSKANEPIQIDARDFEKLYAQAGGGTLIDLSIAAATPVKVMVQAVDRHYLTDAVQHVDFYAVNMAKTVTTTITLHFVGEASASKSLGGTVVKNKDHLTIRCLPGDLIKELTVSIDQLKTFDDVIRVKDIVIPAGITVLDQAGDMIALVEAPRSDEELAALNEVVTEDVTKVEGAVKPEPEAAPAEDVKPKE